MDASISEEGSLIGILPIGFKRYRNPDGTGGAEIILFDRDGELLNRVLAEGTKGIKIDPYGKELILRKRTSLAKMVIR